MTKKCTCHSGHTYPECCMPYHEGTFPQSPLLLMRSRYAAYALNLPEYIIDTTHRDNPQYLSDTKQWKREIAQFSQVTNFAGLTILDSGEAGETGSVTFRATLLQSGQDISFTERSLFKKEQGKWMYLSGEIFT